MTDREADRSPQPTVALRGGAEATGQSTRSASDEALSRAPEPAEGPPPRSPARSSGIEVPGNSSAARNNWRPRVDSDDSVDGDGDGDDSDDSDDGDDSDSGQSRDGAESGDEGDGVEESDGDDGAAPSASESRE